MQGLHLAVGLPVARALGKPVVMKVSGSGIITSMRNFLLGRLELRFLQRWAHRVMILNPGMAAEAAAAGFRADRLLWMPNPVDTGEFAPCAPERRLEIRARHGIPPAAPVIVFVGRLAPEKELPSLLRAFAAVRKDVPDALLALVGDGPVRGDLETLAADLNVSGAIRFTGRRPASDVANWLQAGDLFALVSSNEGLPCSLVEAMAAGLPSVVSAIPGNVQLVEPGVHGLHATVGDSSSIAHALTALIRDERSRARMGSAARRLVLEAYSMDKVADRYEALFSEALVGAK
jgi:glycosyltransferase involved in cell wall biosynthesis